MLYYASGKWVSRFRTTGGPSASGMSDGKFESSCGWLRDTEEHLVTHWSLNIVQGRETDATYHIPQLMGSFSTLGGVHIKAKLKLEALPLPLSIGKGNKYKMVRLKRLGEYTMRWEQRLV